MSDERDERIDSLVHLAEAVAVGWAWGQIAYGVIIAVAFVVCGAYIVITQ